MFARRRLQENVEWLLRMPTCERNKRSSVEVWCEQLCSRLTLSARGAGERTGRGAGGWHARALPGGGGSGARGGCGEGTPPAPRTAALARQPQPKPPAGRHSREYARQASGPNFHVLSLFQSASAI